VHPLVPNYDRCRVKGLRISSWSGPLEPFEAPDPEPGPGELQVRVEACGIGLTVVNYSDGRYATSPLARAVVPGHELVGRVSAAGDGADERLVGARITAHFYLFCGECPLCLAGFEPLCEHSAGTIGTALDGGYADVAVIPSRNAVLLPDSLDPVDATVVSDAVATPVHISRLAAITPGERIVVIGAGGGVGIHLVQVARLRGAEVAGLDVVAEKLAFLEQELGAHAVDSSDFARISLPPRFGGRADVVVDFIGSEASSGWALDRLAPNGRLVLVNTFRDRKLELDPRVLVESQARVLGSRYASRAEIAEAAELLASGRVLPVIGRRVGLDGVQSVHEDLRRGTLLGRGALDLGMQTRD
jgi:D-arabinose 1-dehydrogenase-like Zn-dependent alcohol dehydrogenase